MESDIAAPNISTAVTLCNLASFFLMSFVHSNAMLFYIQIAEAVSPKLQGDWVSSLNL